MTNADILKIESRIDTLTKKDLAQNLRIIKKLKRKLNNLKSAV